MGTADRTADQTITGTPDARTSGVGTPDRADVWTVASATVSTADLSMVVSSGDVVLLLAEDGDTLATESDDLLAA